MHPINPEQEQEFARTLAAYDDALARGHSWDALNRQPGHLEGEFAARLTQAFKLLNALEQVWPRCAEPN
jgi:hypothetical protein